MYFHGLKFAEATIETAPIRDQGRRMRRCAKCIGVQLWIILYLLSSISAELNEFLSIGCGSYESFLDPHTGIPWSPDEPNYVREGQVGFLQASRTTQLQLSTLRFFSSKGRKHCYSLPAVKGSTFLLRAWFLHGHFQHSLHKRFRIHYDLDTMEHWINFEKLDYHLKIPGFEHISNVDNSFRISIDSTIVDVLTWTPDLAHTVVTTEYIFVAKNERVHFCLLPEVGNPFINALELRPLPSFRHIYQNVDLHRNYLKLLYRLDFGANVTDLPVRRSSRQDMVSSPSPSWISNLTKKSDMLVNEEILEEFPPKVMETGWASPKPFGLKFTISEYEKQWSRKLFGNFIWSEGATTRLINRSGSGTEGDGFTSSVLHPYSFIKELSASSKGVKFTFGAHNENTGVNLKAGEIFSVRSLSQGRTHPKDVDALEALKESFRLRSWIGDPCLPVPLDWITCSQESHFRVTEINLAGYHLTGNISLRIAELTALTRLYLNENLLEGDIIDLRPLRRLKVLHLHKNNLTGAIPSTLADLPALTELFLSENNLSGSIPASLTDKPDLELRVDKNEHLCKSHENCTTLEVRYPEVLTIEMRRMFLAISSLRLFPEPEPDEKSSIGSTEMILHVMGTLIFMLVIELPTQLWKRMVLLRRHLRANKALIGRGDHGASGKVYYKLIECPQLMNPDLYDNPFDCEYLGEKTSERERMVIIKSNKIDAAPEDKLGFFIVEQVRKYMLALLEINALPTGSENQSSNGETQFGPFRKGKFAYSYGIDLTFLGVNIPHSTMDPIKIVSLDEVKDFLLARLHHKHLVLPLGCYIDDGTQSLVHASVIQRTLGQCLQGDDMNEQLDWRPGLIVALSVAKGLRYLHHEISPRIIHGNVSCSNILLDAKLKARLAGLIISEHSVDEKEILATLDPEFAKSKKVTRKSDVYCFGIVLGQILRLWPVGDNPREKSSMITKFLETGEKVQSPVDLRQRAVRLTRRCLNDSAGERPLIHEVVRELAMALKEDGVSHHWQSGSPANQEAGVSSEGTWEGMLKDIFEQTCEALDKNFQTIGLEDDEPWESLY